MVVLFIANQTKAKADTLNRGKETKGNPLNQVVRSDTRQKCMKQR